MERLTKYMESGKADIIALEYREKARNVAIQKLAAYEDTGLTPEDVVRINDFEKTQSYKLLEQVAALQAEATAKDTEIVRLKDKLETIESHYAISKNHNELLSSDRDRWKARAEALEIVANGFCDACVHYISGICCNDSNICNWQLVEARFARGGGRDE